MIYPLGVALLIPVSSAAYPSLAAATGPAARTAPLPAISLVVATTPPPPVTTVLAPSEADRLRRDLTAIAAGSGGRVGISLQELSGPRRTSLSINGGLTKVANAFYQRTVPRIYVVSAPHFVANAGLTLSAWRGWSGSLRLRAINHYRLDDSDSSVVAGGHTVVDLGVSRRIVRGLDFSLSIDNLTNRDYYETQNYFQSRLPGQEPAFRIHGTPGYPLTAIIGLTFRLGG